MTRRQVISAKLDPFLIEDLDDFGRELFPPNGNRNRAIEKILRENVPKKKRVLPSFMN